MKTAAQRDERATTAKFATLVVGVGSAHGDDQFGWLVAKHLASSSADGGAVVRSARSPAELLDWLEGFERLIVCDACQGLGSPGAIHSWSWPDVPRRALRTAGTHDLGLAAVLELAQQLGLLPAETLLWCVEIETPRPGGAVSACIEAAAVRAAGMIRQAIAGKPPQR
jgi:hydrogenase maturation protease